MLAAILAHEISHILLKHNYNLDDSRQWEENIQTLNHLTAMGMAASNLGLVKKGGRFSVSSFVSKGRL